MDRHFAESCPCLAVCSNCSTVLEVRLDSPAALAVPAAATSAPCFCCALSPPACSRDSIPQSLSLCLWLLHLDDPPAAAVTAAAVAAAAVAAAAAADVGYAEPPPPGLQCPGSLRSMP